jgi:hypothetical protein
MIKNATAELQQYFCISCALLAAEQVCRAAVMREDDDTTCDVPESCSGTSFTCPNDDFKASGTECRRKDGVCDKPEVCTGTSARCPDDAYADTGLCRAADDECDIPEYCDGSGKDCPTDTYKTAGDLCRRALGACDKPEQCVLLQGNPKPKCPTDLIYTAADKQVCRTSKGCCDPPEVCDGTMVSCPTDIIAGANTVCLETHAVDGAICTQDQFTCNGVRPDCPYEGKAKNP